MFQVGRNEVWIADFDPAPEAAGALVARHYSSGVRLDLSLELPLSSCRDWVRDWLTAYLETLAQADRDQEVTFFYVVFDDRLSRDSLGRVAENGSVQLLRFGSSPSGPIDGEEITLAELVGLTLDALQ